MKIVKKAAALCLAVTVLLTGSGCSGRSNIYYEYREIEKLEIIRSIGIDSSGDNVTATVCSGIGLNGQKARVIVKEEKTLATALNVIQNDLTGNEPFYPHTDNIIIGEQAARGGISGYLDYIARTAEIRADTSLFVVKGDTAQALLEGTNGEITSAADMLQSLNSKIGRIGDGFMVSCRELTVNLAEHGKSLALAVRVKDSDEVDAESGKKMIVPAGFAIIEGERLVSFVPEDLAHSVCVVMNETALGHIVVSDGAGGEAVLGYEWLKTKITPVFEGGVPVKLKVEIDCGMSVDEIGSDINLSDEVQKDLALQVAEREADGAKAVLEMSREMKLDFMNLGSVVDLKAPVKFAKMPVSWEEAFSDIEFEVTANAIIAKTFDIGNPIKIQEQ